MDEIPIILILQKPHIAPKWKYQKDRKLIIPKAKIKILHEY